MSRRLKILFVAAFALLLGWGSVSWYFGQESQRAFSAYVTQLQEQSHQHFFEIDVDEYQESFLGAEARVTVNFSIPSLKRLFGELTLQASRLNGPVFINQDGLSFGSARWELSIDQDADKVLANTVETLFNNEHPSAIIRLDFFEQLHFSLAAKYIRSRYFTAEDLIASGLLHLSNGAYEFETTSRQSSVSMAGLSVDLPDFNIAIQRPTQKPGLDARSNSAIIDINAMNSVLSLKQSETKFPLNISSRGSLWLINDTLNGDWQMLFEAKPAEFAQTLHVNVQFREWLTEGFLAYWRQQADIANLQAQAEWALEEGAETPEEQDFIMSLLGDAERIQQAQSLDILKPMLKYPHSQLAVNAQLKKTGDILGQLIIEGKTEGSEQFPMLAVSGEAAIQRGVLNESGVAQFDRLGRRMWLRGYETVFEADVAVRERQLLLNNIRVSWADFSAELKQLLNDQ